MKGGKFISSGSYGCVTSPPVKCEENTTRDKAYYKDTVGKFFSNAKSAVDEYNLQKIVNSIDPKKEWTILMFKKCSIHDFTKSDESDKCDLIDPNENTSYTQIIYKKGGKDLNEIIDNSYTNPIEQKRSLFVKIFKALRPILVGLQSMNKKGYSHLDIKPGNILYDGQKLFVIDFGLMMNSKKVFNASNERFLLFDYPYYPPEFKLYGLFAKSGRIPNITTLQKSFNRNLDHFEMNDETKRRARDQLIRFLSIINSNSKRVQAELDKLRTKIDIYSLGMTLFELQKYMISEHNTTTYIINSLIEKLINMNPFERLDWENIIDEYDIIIKIIGNFSK